MTPKKRRKIMWAAWPIQIWRERTENELEAEEELRKNRLAFLQDFEVVEYVGCRRPKYGSVAMDSSYMDHCETFRHTSGAVIFTTSPYNEGIPYWVGEKVNDEVVQLQREGLKTFRLEETAPLYHLKASTFWRGFENKWKYNAWLKNPEQAKSVWDILKRRREIAEVATADGVPW